MLSRCHAIISVSWRRRGWDGQYGKALAELSVFGPRHTTRWCSPRSRWTKPRSGN